MLLVRFQQSALLNNLEVNDMTFMNDLEKKLNNEKQLTENGAVGYRTSGKELLDLNFAVSSMRNWDENEICKAYTKAYYENPLLAVKWLFYLRDIRGNGMGERRAFRICFKWLVENHFDNVRALVELIPEYGRYDDWMCLLDSKASEVVSVQIKKQLEIDICNMEQGREISLLAKWLPSCNASSSKTKQYAKIVCNMLGLKESEYRKTLSTLRAYLNVVEVKMSAGEWEDINYSNLPSRANLLYGNAFLRNDEERRRAFLSKLSRGDVTINASTLFPSDIVHKYYQASSKRRCDLGNFDDTLEGLWNSLPNFIEGDNSTLVVRDGSGSMDTTVGNTNVTALEVSTALAIYFSEHLTGHFYNKFITFSSRPAMIDMSNATCLRDKLEICEAHSDCSNTDLKAVFDLILNTAVENKLNQSELPKNILIVSDMEFDSMMGTYSRWGSYNQDDSSTKTLLESIAAEYQAYGYTLPRLIFWNVCSRTNTIMLQENEAGVALVSGFNPAVYNMVLSNDKDSIFCQIKTTGWQRCQFSHPLHFDTGFSNLFLRIEELKKHENLDVCLYALEVATFNTYERLQAKAKSLRSNTSWMADLPYGFFFHWNSKSMPLAGEQLTYEEAVNNFDVDRFAQVVHECGGKLVFFTTTWAEYYFPAPIHTIDSILPGRTTKRDLIADLSDALSKYDIRLILYYHIGHGDKEWWNKQNYTRGNAENLFTDKKIY